MIIRNAAVRHGRAWAPPLSKSTLRQLSTDVARNEPSAPQASDATELPKIVPSVRKKARYMKTHVQSLLADTAHDHRGLSWTKPHKLSPAPSGRELTPTEQYETFQRIQKNTRKLGTEIKGRYVPSALLMNPPRPEDVSLELLMASQTHVGHHRSLWNPANSRYIYGQRDSTHIISLEVTAAHLRRAARVVEETAYRGGIILFVGTRRGQMEIVTRAAELAEGCHVFTRWIAGTITNRDVLLQDKMAKVVDVNDEEQPGFKEFLKHARPLTPDLVICLNPTENHALLHECALAKIPTIGIIDTDCEPSWVTYGIPANDDSHRSTGLIAGTLGRAGQAGQRRRRQSATKGTQTWEQPYDLTRHVEQSVVAARESREDALKKLRANVMGFTDEERALLQSQFPYQELEMTEGDMLAMMGQSVADEVAKGGKGGGEPRTVKVAAEQGEKQAEAVLEGKVAVGEASKESSPMVRDTTKKE